MSMRIGLLCRAVSARRPAGAPTGRTATPTDRHPAPQGATS
ncbi:hypothetical protein ACWC9R_34460 [Streptomyces sp. NPDC001219]